MKGDLRKEIMDECPEEFEETLKDFIDKIEGLSSDILSNLNINSINELDKIEDAYRLTDELCDGLW